MKLAAFGLLIAVLLLAVACMESWRAKNYVKFEWTSGLQRQYERQVRTIKITRSFEKMRRQPWKRDLLELTDGTVLSLTIYDRRAWIVTPRVIIPEFEEE